MISICRVMHRKGFTLVELMVVLAMIGIIIAALTTAVTEARERAKIERARSEVSIMTQAILAYENYDKGVSLPVTDDEGKVANIENLKFLIGDGETTEAGDAIPALMLAQLRNGSVMRDPWYTPYVFKIKSSEGEIKLSNTAGKMSTGFFLPNFYNLKEGERK